MVSSLSAERKENTLTIEKSSSSSLSLGLRHSNSTIVYNVRVLGGKKRWGFVGQTQTIQQQDKEDCKPSQLAWKENRKKIDRHGVNSHEALLVFDNTDDVLPPGVENDDSDGEVDAVEDLRIDNSISNSKHEFSENEESDFDNPSVLLPPPEPSDEEFNFGDEISAVRNTILSLSVLMQE
nr:hypothetical protein [Tanacetum cinerariifolium]